MEGLFGLWLCIAAGRGVPKSVHGDVWPCQWLDSPHYCSPICRPWFEVPPSQRGISSMLASRHRHRGLNSMFNYSTKVFPRTL
jgi:hypothetical protein